MVMIRIICRSLYGDGLCYIVARVGMACIYAGVCLAMACIICRSLCGDDLYYMW